jgi:hypothetical protein
MFNNKRIKKLEGLTKLHSRLHDTIFNDSHEHGENIDRIFTILSNIILVLENFETKLNSGIKKPYKINSKKSLDKKGINIAKRCKNSNKSGLNGKFDIL